MPVLILVNCVENLVFKKYKEKIPTPIQKSMFSAEVDEEAAEHAEDAEHTEDAEEDRHVEDASRPRKGNTILA